MLYDLPMPDDLLPSFEPCPNSGVVQIQVTRRQLVFGGLRFSKSSVSPKLVGFVPTTPPVSRRKQTCVASLPFLALFRSSNPLASAAQPKLWSLSNARNWLSRPWRALRP